ncbi:MAG: formate dehydrogenase accessory sulfurtransferase FdhD, partial [Gallionella sp.]
MSHTEIACISTQSISRWRDELRSEERDDLVVEIPVALEFNGISHAVMLATPCDLESFALGFSFSEGIIKNRGEFFGAEVEESDLGITVHCDISSAAFLRLKQRRRNMTGRTGCGLCGVESLE